VDSNQPQRATGASANASTRSNGRRLGLESACVKTNRVSPPAQLGLFSLVISPRRLKISVLNSARPISDRLDLQQDESEYGLGLIRAVAIEKIETRL
jgi:hypothetical protein